MEAVTATPILIAILQEWLEGDLIHHPQDLFQPPAMPPPPLETMTMQTLTILTWPLQVSHFKIEYKISHRQLSCNEKEKPLPTPLYKVRELQVWKLLEQRLALLIHLSFSRLNAPCTISIEVLCYSLSFHESFRTVGKMEFLNDAWDCGNIFSKWNYMMYVT